MGETSSPAAAAFSTGYGPSGNNRRLFFNGNIDSYELWEVKFLGHMRLRKLHTVFEGAPGDVDDNDNDNANAFAELIQLINDRSLSLVIRDSMNNGRNALDILREHYKGKRRIFFLHFPTVNFESSLFFTTNHISK